MPTIDPATPSDVAAISLLLGEIEAYYGGAATPADEGQIKSALFSDAPAANVLLAREGAEVIGLASYSFLWPAAGADTSLYLKELFVRETNRRTGVARALLTAVRAAASEAGCSRVEWTADQDNPTALDFYEAIGAQPNAGKVFYRLEQHLQRPGHCPDLTAKSP